MGKIHVLSSEVSNKIAAGEVVERPSSVIKELVENSIDAGATLISVEIKKGGSIYMRVSDNGSGMSEEDAKICFLRHATSKVQTSSDLDAIYTLGFRGEALSSIGAVAEVELFTKRHEDETGVCVTCKGGEILSSDEAGIPDGTSILVENLFFNTPARRKFLKKDATEAGYITDIMTRFIFAHPEISFKLIIDNKEKLFSPGDNSLENSVYTVYGRDYAKGTIPVEYESDGIKITGLIGKGTLARPKRNYQSFFVNRRYITSRTIIAALENAYKNQIMIGKFPMAILNIEINPSLIDINVHPRKDEVRFHEARLVHDVLLETVANSLRKELRSVDDGLKKESGVDDVSSFEDKDQGADENPLGQFVKDIKSASSSRLEFSSYSGGNFDKNKSFGADNYVALDSIGNRRRINYSPHAIQMPSSKDSVKENLRRYDYRIAAGNAQSRAGIYDIERVDLTSPKAAKLLSLPAPDVLLVMQENRYFLVKASVLNRELVSRDYMAKVKLGTVEVYSLSMPFVLKAQKTLINAIKACPEALVRAGFTLNLKKESIEFLKIPSLLQGVDLAGILVKALPLAAAAAKNLSMGICPKQLADMFAAAKKSVVYYKDEAQVIVDKISDPEILESLGADAFELDIARWARELGGANNA